MLINDNLWSQNANLCTKIWICDQKWLILENVCLFIFISCPGLCRFLSFKCFTKPTLITSSGEILRVKHNLVTTLIFVFLFILSSALKNIDLVILSSLKHGVVSQENETNRLMLHFQLGLSGRCCHEGSNSRKLTSRFLQAPNYSQWPTLARN